MKEDPALRPSLNLVPYKDTSLDYLHKQITCLERYKHNLSQVTLAMAYNSDNMDCQSHWSFMQEAERLDGTLVQGAKIRTLWREANDGQSYASWSQVVRIYKDSFDYYLFIEDDYVPVVDNFDRIMEEEYERKTCDYLCTYKNNNVFVSNGIIGPRGLRNHNWQINYRSNDDWNHMQTFLYSMTTDMPDPPWQCAPYYGDHKKFSGIFFFGKGKYLFAPTQMVNSSGEVTDLPNEVYTLD